MRVHLFRKRWLSLLHLWGRWHLWDEWRHKGRGSGKWFRPTTRMCLLWKDVGIQMWQFNKNALVGVISCNYKALLHIRTILLVAIYILPIINNINHTKTIIWKYDAVALIKVLISNNNNKLFKKNSGWQSFVLSPHSTCGSIKNFVWNKSSSI